MELAEGHARQLLIRLTVFDDDRLTVLHRPVVVAEVHFASRRALLRIVRRDIVVGIRIRGGRPEVAAVVVIVLVVVVLIVIVLDVRVLGVAVLIVIVLAVRILIVAVLVVAVLVVI